MHARLILASNVVPPGDQEQLFNIAALFYVNRPGIVGVLTF